MTARWRILGWGVLYALAAPALPAQVGHPPDASPYRDIRKGHVFSITGGHIGGDGGDFGLGPHNGWVLGARYDIRSGSTIQLGLGVSRGELERFIINPTLGPATRRSGPVEQSVTFVELQVQLNLTGGKSWNRFAPFISGTGGMALAGDTPADDSGFDFGRKLYFAPAAGFRLFLSDRLHLGGAARLTFWRLNYPVTFQQEPAPPEDPEPVIEGDNLTEWTVSPWFQAGLGYSFSP